MKKTLFTMASLMLIWGMTTAQAQVTFNGNGNSGFGGPIGPSSMVWEDDGTTITVEFTKGPGGFNDAMVIYLYTGADGRNVIDEDVNDEQDPLRTAISSAGDNRSNITFFDEFEASHAIAINTNDDGLWAIPSTGTIGDGDLVFINSISSTLTSPTQASFTFSFDWADLGMTPGDDLGFNVTYLNAGNGFTSNEGYGQGLPGSNVGSNPITFTSYWQYPSGDEIEGAPILPEFRDVTFSVDMSIEIDNDRFDPETNRVYVAGSFNGWSTTANELVAGANEIYSVTIEDIEGFEGNNIQYKFLFDTTPDATWEDDPNRIFTLGEDGVNQETPLVFFNENFGPEFRDITFTVDMSIQEAKGEFDPATETVYVRGSFNRFSDINPLNDIGDGAYSSTFAVKGFDTDVINYKFYFGTDATDGTWEGNVGDGGDGEDREFALGAEGDAQDIPTSMFNNEHGAIITEAMGIGWRTLSNPTATTLQTFLSQIWTQGVPGADYEGGDSNVRVWAVDDDELIDLPNLADENRLAGTGFMLFVYEDDDYPNGANNWPKVLSTTAEAFASDVTVDAIDAINQSASTGSEDGFTLLGNPFFESIDFEALTTSGNINNAFYVADRTDWVPWSPILGTPGIIAPFQGFFIQNDGTEGTRELTFTEASKTEGGTFYNVDQDYDANIRLAFSNNDMSTSVFIQLAEQGSLDRLRVDALSLQPLSSEYLIINTVKEDIPLSIASFPSHEQTLQIPVNVQSTNSGSFTITVSHFDVLNDWNLELIDTLTGASIELTENTEYTFELEGVGTTASAMEKTIRGAVLASEATRFVLNASTTSTSAPVDNELPAKLALNQNYPNPFNPTTQISYDLPESADVRLEVFNIQGQRVATLVNAAQNAGTHTVTFDAANLASGVYLYRLQAGAAVLTKKMTLVK